jgi:plasmid stabilization system protein ParE
MTDGIRVRWTRTALTDVAGHVAYLDQVNPMAAHDLAEALLDAADSLTFMPERGRPGRVAGTRELVIVRPYIMVYTVNMDSVTILKIWHSRLYF